MSKREFNCQNDSWRMDCPKRSRVYQKSELRSLYMKPIFALALVVVSVTSSLAQYAETIVSDRPGQGNSPLTVGKGIVQLQSGFGYDFFENGSWSWSRDNFTSDNVVKIGVFERFELSTQLAYSYEVTEGYNSWSAYFRSVNHGLSGLVVSGRYNLLVGDKWKPSLGIQGGVNLPWQHEYFEHNHAFYNLTLMGSINPTKKLSILANLGASDMRENMDYAFGFYVLNTGYQLFPKLSLFAEVYGDIDPYSTPKFDGGLAYLINDNLQLDVFGGYYEYREDKIHSWFVNIGVSWRMNAFR